MLLKAGAVLTIWCLVLAGIAWLMQAPDWFWYHYIGTMPIDTYRWLSALVCLGSFVGAILLILAGIAVTVRMASSGKPKVYSDTAELN